MGTYWCYAVAMFLLSIALIRGNPSNVAESMFGKHTAVEYCDKFGEVCRTKKQCWGYEEGCSDSANWYLKPQCNDEQGWQVFKTNDEKVHQFWRDTDFGYVKNVIDTIRTVCEPQEEGDSSFVCNEALTFCKAKNLYMDLTSDGRPLNRRLNDNPFQDGQLGGHCKYVPGSLDVRAYRRVLFSWVLQIERYSSLPFHPIKDGHCDVVVEKPTFLMQLDEVNNMYHHFCGFLNLYATLHVNGSFNKDVNIVFFDQPHRRRRDYFAATWNAFTDNPVTFLSDAYGDKRVCFKDAIFALLPRMLHGLFYNKKMPPGCFKTGLFKAFNRFLIERLKIGQERNLTDPGQPIRVGLLSRETKYRKIVNQEEVVDAFGKLPGITFDVLAFNGDVPFLEQIKVTHNLDILLGMHGAGLTHMLFLPDWAAVFEIYNCGEIKCYRDLARLRGVDYFTWEDGDKVFDKTEVPNEHYKNDLKFRNFSFDVDELVRIVKKAIEQVKKNLEEYKKH